MRKIDAKNTIDILNDIEEKLSFGEVLQIYPYPFMARHGWFLQTMKVYNNFVLDCTLTELARTA